MLSRCRLVVALVWLVTGATLAFGAEPKLLSAAETATNSDRALVFIHGFLGSPDHTFASWPQIIAADNTQLPDHGKVSDFAIYSVDYEADFQSQAKLDQIAVGVSRDLAASEIFKRHRHVWLVAHSMGGIVLKRTLTLWEHERKDVLTDRVLAVGLLGVPSKGAPLADTAKKFRVDQLASTFGWDGRLLAELSTNSGSYLDSLETDWLAMKRNRETGLQRRFTPVISCGFEEKPQLSAGTGVWWLWDVAANLVHDTTVVPNLFTSTACDVARGFSVRHTDLTKPQRASDSIHLWLRDLIILSITQGRQEERVQLTTRPPSVNQSVPGRVDFNLFDRVEVLNQSLEPQNLDRQTGMPINPEHTVLGDPTSEQRAKLLVLRGGPFTGSTLLEAWQSAASKNKCLGLTNSANRLTITLTITDQVVQCVGAANVCKGQTCD